jgi:hypothetical protein
MDSSDDELASFRADTQKRKGPSSSTLVGIPYRKSSTIVIMHEGLEKIAALSRNNLARMQLVDKNPPAEAAAATPTNVVVASSSPVSPLPTKQGTITKTTANDEDNNDDETRSEGEDGIDQGWGVWKLEQVRVAARNGDKAALRKLTGTPMWDGQWELLRSVGQRKGGDRCIRHRPTPQQPQPQLQQILLPGVGSTGGGGSSFLTSGTAVIAVEEEGDEEKEDHQMASLFANGDDDGDEDDKDDFFRLDATNEHLLKAAERHYEQKQRQAPQQRHSPLAQHRSQTQSSSSCSPSSFGFRNSNAAVRLKRLPQRSAHAVNATLNALSNGVGLQDKGTTVINRDCMPMPSTAQNGRRLLPQHHHQRLRPGTTGSERLALWDMGDRSYGSAPLGRTNVHDGGGADSSTTYIQQEFDPWRPRRERTKQLRPANRAQANMVVKKHIRAKQKSAVKRGTDK